MVDGGDKDIRLLGRITSGRGLSAPRLKLWEQLANKTGVSGYFPGTLNVEIRTPVHFKGSMALNLDGFGHQNLRVWPAVIDGIPCKILRWVDCPLHILEVIHPSRLRDVLGKGDGESVEVVVRQRNISKLTGFCKLFYFLLWRLPNRNFYQDRKYELRLRSLLRILGLKCLQD